LCYAEKSGRVFNPSLRLHGVGYKKLSIGHSTDGSPGSYME